MPDGHSPVAASPKSDLRQDLRSRLHDIESDVRISNHLVDLIRDVVGNINVADALSEKGRDHACSAIIGLDLQLAAIAGRLSSLADEIRADANLS